MKTTLIVIQNEAEHADAKRLVEKLMGSSGLTPRSFASAEAEPTLNTVHCILKGMDLSQPS
jgi:hypothetical protein